MRETRAQAARWPSGGWLECMRAPVCEYVYECVRALVSGPSRPPRRPTGCWAEDDQLCGIINGSVDVNARRDLETGVLSAKS